MSQIDVYNLIAIERGAPKGWQWFSIQVVGDLTDRPSGAFLLEGAMRPPDYTRGKWKGQPNWSKRDKSTDRKIVITTRDYDERKRRWVLETGTCAECDSGKTVASCGISGTTYRDCQTCNGTGRIAQPTPCEVSP